MASTLPRITARVDIDTQALLCKAAAISGVSSINSFVVSAAIEKAKQIIEKEQILELSARDSILLIEALNKPDLVNKNLQTAFARYTDIE